MDTVQERRREKRLRYHWPVWFGYNFEDTLEQGQMADVSSGGAAFTCHGDFTPTVGQRLTARFSVPKYSDDNFDVENYIRNARVCRVSDISPYIRKVAVQFEQDLPFKPGEQANDTIIAAAV